MKREIFAAVLLAVMLVCSIINTNQISTLTNTVESLVSQAVRLAEKGSWSDSVEHAVAALHTWQGASPYTDIILRHEKTEMTTDILYDFIRDLKTKNEINVTNTSEKLIEMLQNIKSMESIKLGSIF